MKIAAVIVKNDTNTYVLCPYCAKPHSHGNVEKGQTLSAHCMAGEYEVGEPFDFSGIMNAVSRRTKDVQRKRALREAARRAKEIQEWAAKESAKP
jgi:hypothetical protein